MLRIRYPIVLHRFNSSNTIHIQFTKAVNIHYSNYLRHTRTTANGETVQIQAFSACTTKHHLTIHVDHKKYRLAVTRKQLTEWLLKLTNQCNVYISHKAGSTHRVETVNKGIKCSMICPSREKIRKLKGH